MARTTGRERLPLTNQKKNCLSKRLYLAPFFGEGKGSSASTELVQVRQVTMATNFSDIRKYHSGSVVGIIASWIIFIYPL